LDGVTVVVFAGGLLRQLIAEFWSLFVLNLSVVARTRDIETIASKSRAFNKIEMMIPNHLI